MMKINKFQLLKRWSNNNKNKEKLSFYLAMPIKEANMKPLALTTYCKNLISTALEQLQTL